MLASTLDDVYAGIDRAIGRIIAALPDDASVMVVSPVGMDVNTSRADMLPEMLKAILDGPRADARTCARRLPACCRSAPRST